MRTLPMPVDDPGDVYRTCISRVDDPAFKQRLAAVEPEVVSAATLYATRAAVAQLHTISPQDNVAGVVSRDEMSSIYTQRFAKQGSPGRPVYDRILAAPKYGTCPLCGIRKVSSVDHHLPKAHYPALVVVPTNLVPACSDCNKSKGDMAPTTEEQQTIHPYFDHVDGARWLYAEVVEETPPAIRYFVQPPPGWSSSTGLRVVNHFARFKLGVLYTSFAAEELENIRHSMQILFRSAGSQGIQCELLDRSESCAEVHVNSWRTAMYTALAASDWYCNGGFGV